MIEKFPQLQGYKAFKVPLSVDARSLIKCQLAIAALRCKPCSVFTSFIVVMDITAYNSRIVYPFFGNKQMLKHLRRCFIIPSWKVFIKYLLCISFIVIFYLAIEVGFCNLHSHKGCLRKFTFRQQHLPCYDVQSLRSYCLFVLKETWLFFTAFLVLHFEKKNISFLGI